MTKPYEYTWLTLEIGGLQSTLINARTTYNYGAPHRTMMYIREAEKQIIAIKAKLEKELYGNENQSGIPAGLPNLL